MPQLTIGQVARSTRVRTSTLRYYEDQGLLTPAGRTAAGYRLYAPAAIQTVRFIKRAQRLGFSLVDIATLLRDPTYQTVVALAEQRFRVVERRLTELLVAQHELEHLVRELEETRPETIESKGLFDQVCNTPLKQNRASSILEWLAERTDCKLADDETNLWLDTLRGQHIHIWSQDDAFHILVVGHEPAVIQALHQLANLDCNRQMHPALKLEPHPEGTLLIASGENAHIFARLFLALESN